MDEDLSEYFIKQVNNCKSIDQVLQVKNDIDLEIFEFNKKIERLHKDLQCIAEHKEREIEKYNNLVQMNWINICFEKIESLR